jgi:Tfp pilus assembly protein PilN
VLATALLLGTWRQQRALRAAEESLAALERPSLLATAEHQELARLHADLQAAQAEAQLQTYLGSSWPRSRIVSAVIAPLPAAVTLRELRVVRESAAAGPAPRSESPGPLPAADPRPAATRDLEQLLGEAARGPEVVTLSGRTTDLGELHLYLAALARQDVFAKVALGSIRRVSEDARGGAEFTARLVVRSAPTARPREAESPAAAAAAVARSGGRP